jgi:hypothetical protein
VLIDCPVAKAAPVTRIREKPTASRLSAASAPHIENSFISLLLELRRCHPTLELTMAGLRANTVVTVNVAVIKTVSRIRVDHPKVWM